MWPSLSIKNNQPIGILDLGVRIFPNGRDPKNEPLAVTRRKKRGERRTRDRGQNRVRRLVKELIQFGLLPQDEQLRKQVFNDYCPYQCRAMAAQKQVDAYTLGRALFHIGRRRGFKSNRLAEEQDDTNFKAKITHLRSELQNQTLGQYLYNKIQANQALAKNNILAIPIKTSNQRQMPFLPK